MRKKQHRSCSRKAKSKSKSSMSKEEKKVLDSFFTPRQSDSIDKLLGMAHTLIHSR